MTALEIAGRLHAKRSGSGWSARCPAHQDRNASLSIGTGADGKVLLKCHAGCSVENICAALGIELLDLFPDRNGESGLRIEAEYDYVDERGTLLFQVVRLFPKDFRQRAPDKSAKDGWTWSTNGVRKVLYRLPKVLDSIKRGLPVLIAEGEKDVHALEQRGFRATCNPGGAGKWQDSFSESLRAADAVIVADKDNAGRAHAQLVASKLHDIAKSVRVMELPNVNGKPVKDAADFFAAGGDRQEFTELFNATPEWTPAQRKMPTRSNVDELQRAIADSRLKLRLPGADRLLSEFASDLARLIREKEIFLRSGEIVMLTDGELKPMTPQTFRSWAEKFFIGYRAKTIGENSFEFDVTMTDNEARGTLAAPQFTDLLRCVRRVNRTRLPIFAPDGKIVLLPNGYHEETQTLTLTDEEFNLDMPLNVAVETLNSLLAEFCFADGGRSKAVAVAAMTGLFANQLLPEKSLRPCFIFVANAEGAGKTLLAQICITPTLGSMPVGSKPDDDDEMRKTILTAVRETLSVIFLDNLKGRLSSEPLEAFLSAPSWKGRKLGVNETITGENLATVFCTGNGMTVSPDMRRRSLFVELHLEAERAEDRQFKRSLDFATLLAMRPQILTALWSLVKHWDSVCRPQPSRGHSAFPGWASIIGGIVEAAGFCCPLETASVTVAADPDGEDMHKLVTAMTKNAASCTFSELIELAREHGLFEHVIGPEGEDPGRREKSAFGKLLCRYDRRLVSKCRFIAEGKGKTRRYRIENGNGENGQNGVSTEKS